MRINWDAHAFYTNAQQASKGPIANGLRFLLQYHFKLSISKVPLNP